MIEQLTTEQFGDFLLVLMKNKPKVIEELIADIAATEKQYEGLVKVIPSLTPETSDANLRHQLKTCMQIQAQQSLAMRKLLMLVLVGTSSSDFDADVTRLANKFGRGDEALREMFKQKLQGR
jgi:hypothetical protein